ncbi:MAG: bifunctional 3,4-dihydroxy-2-butanone-4-phosphate synthase/GTP cyclohydrolase II, partial [Candidatus Thermoplasmatota archaeon]|nr:bifunctional 3,4-dihydroxy-2-butanone-4-phosphate synthase/GTP cyclohydrolase II [Candidatus Thermoplasmatota archaeon]
QAYALQDIGYDTLDANLALGLPADARDYTIAAKMLADAGVNKVRLMTNNPMKIQGLRNNGIEVDRRVEHISGVSIENINYLSTKGKRMGHILDI